MCTCTTISSDGSVFEGKQRDDTILYVVVCCSRLKVLREKEREKRLEQQRQQQE